MTEDKQYKDITITTKGLLKMLDDVYEAVERNEDGMLRMMKDTHSVIKKVAKSTMVLTDDLERRIEILEELMIEMENHVTADKLRKYKACIQLDRVANGTDENCKEEHNGKD